jgi:adenylylsulfate kinase-like enzyme
MPCIWITGLSGSGKTTLAREVVSTLMAAGVPAPVSLDGDQLRLALSNLVAEGSYSRDGRLKLARTYAQLCSLLSSQGLTVVIATMSLFHEVHDWNKENIPGYFEVLLVNDLDELIANDGKGLYGAHPIAGDPERVGIDIPAEFPKAADLQLVDSRREPPQDLAARVVTAFCQAQRQGGRV